MKRLLLLILFSGILLFGCKTPDCDCEPEQNDTIPAVIPSDSDTIPLDTIPHDTTVLPVTNDTVKLSLKSHIDSALPMTGLVLWVDNANDLDAAYRKSISLEFAYCLPCRVVKGKENGVVQYDWSSFDAMLDDIASREHQAIVRFRYEYPSSTDVDGKKGTTAVPDYIKSMSDYNETYSKNPGGDGPTYYADWSNAELQWFTKQFYTDFCARYAHDNRLAFLETGFGHWSEYHIYGTDLKLGQNFPSKDYQTEFYQHLAQVCDGLPWLVSIDAADDYYSPFTATNSLMQLKFGLFDDSFMHEGHEIGSSDGYNEENWNAIGKGTRWQTGPCGGEISYYTDRDQHDFLNPQGLYGVTWEEASAKYHISFMIANDAPEGSYGSAERFLEAAHASGYRFEVTDLKRVGKEVILTIKNTGIAPIYRPAYVSVDGERNIYNLMSLMPGQSENLFFHTDTEGDVSVRIESDFTLADIPFEADL